MSSRDLDSFSLVYRPDGSLYSAEPASAAAIMRGTHELTEARRESTRLTVSAGEEPLRVLARPVVRSDGTWVVAVGTSLTPASAAADRAVRDLDIGVPVLVILTGIGAWLLAGASLRPVDRMRADASRLSQRDESGRISVPERTAELARLATTFNGLLDRADYSLDRQRKFVADTGHELRTPLAVLRIELELADSPSSTHAELAEAISHARSEAERLSKLADDMLFLARADSASPLVHLEPTALSVVIATAIRAHRAKADSLTIDLGLKCPETTYVLGDGAALRRIMDNLLSNSLAVTPPGGHVRVEARHDGEEVVVVVSDTGPGFPPDFLPHAFERFTRPDPARASGRHGAGLGLAIVAEIASAHGGRVSAGNRPDGGASVTLTLIATAPERQPAPPSHSNPAPGR